MTTTKKTKGYTKNICELSTIKFRTKDNIITWFIMNNLYKHRLDIESAFINWSARVEPENMNAKDFCNYVVSKDQKNLRCYLFSESKFV